MHVNRDWLGDKSDDDTPKGCGNRLRILAMLTLIGLVVWKW
jgi:hypothetical protein